MARHHRAVARMAFTALFCAALVLPAPAAAAPCDAPANEIVAENCLAGTPQSAWDVVGSGDATIQGFATDISADQGQTVAFKIDTPSTDYRLDIYRLGYYGGSGARLVDTIQPSAPLPQTQPACFSDTATGLVDCGNWTASASWNVPSSAASGIYVAKAVREDVASGGSHIVFVVRDDDGTSELLFQTSDTTWQAYNESGGNLPSGNSLYAGSTSWPSGRAVKVSYNRPFTTRGDNIEDWLFNAEYPMLRWLERNGYDVSYSTDVDTDRRASELLEHQVFMSVGHDEYWSAGQRAAVEAARAAGIHLAFFSGNEIYWKTRWEPSTDGSSTPYRTLVTYKEGTQGELTCGTKCDPLTSVWTGLWRSGCEFSPPADGCRPENALSGQISWFGSTHSMDVPAADGQLRFWRDTDIAALTPGQVATLPAGVLGYEWDFEQFEDSYPPGRLTMSESSRDGRTHRLSLYRHAGGALVFGAGTVQWSWGLDSVHDRGSAAPDARMQQATVNLLADMGAQAQSLQSGLTAASQSTDTAAPTSTINAPADGSSVPAGSTVVVSGTATDAGGGVVVGVDVSTDGGASWRRATGRESWTFSWTPAGTGPVTVRSRAVDDSANLEAAGSGATVTVEARQCPCSLWSATTVPGTASANDAGAVELGVKFRAEADGFITGIRFYKGGANAGTHVGHLWRTDGTMLAEATFIGESASGWQEVTLGSPATITANATYIASYHAPQGGYAFDGNYFASTWNNPPLRALASGEEGGNGVFRYGASGGFPDQTFNAGNYWVDVVFVTETGPDETAPTVTSTAPTANAAGVVIGVSPAATFSEAMNDSTVDGSTFELRDPSNALVPATITYGAAARTATLDPTAALQHSTTYTATVRGGVGGVADLAGNPLAADHSWSFTTAAAPGPPPDEGPGGPILVVANASNPFGRYVAEILRTEGLNAFTVTDISALDAADLNAHDVVILGETPLTSAQVTLLTAWVSGGGNLIAMRPDPQLAGLLGLASTSGTVAEGYLLVDTSSPPGSGIVGETIQFHGVADRYTLNGATSVATLFSDATTATVNPAVTLRTVGSNGGQAAAFAYDLARSVVYTRQGNPDWSGLERDGLPPIRPDDLFFGGSETDWVNLNKVAIPQADEQQRLLTNLIEHVNLDRKPLPRFWYLPRGERAAVVMTGDDHGAGGTSGRFAQYDAASPAGCVVADWECIRSTSYVYPGVPITDAQAASFEAQGFEIALHVDTGCGNWTATSLESFYATQLASFAAQFPSVTPPRTNRTHCIVWSDYATQPQVELNHGIRLDTNYYYWPPGWVQDRPGFFTGSGMPMRFANLDGSMIDTYQATTQMTDESGQSYPFTINTLLDRALGSQGYYGVFTANMHTDSASSSGSDAIVASARARGVPVVSALQMLGWIDGRNASSFGSLQWTGNSLTFTLAVGAGANGLRGMVPSHSAVGALSGLTRNGSTIAFTTETIKGVEYATFSAGAGSYEALYSPDTTAPAITGRSAVPAADGTAALITWVTDESADSRVDYGTSPGALNQNVTDGELVTSHSVGLSGLTPNTTYHFRVTSADGASNAATSPPTGDPPDTFTTPSASIVDTTSADFGAGLRSGTYVAEMADGEVILQPGLATEFSGSALPPGWNARATPWASGGSATIGGGALSVDGTMVATDSTFGPGRSLEFAATFAAQPFQHAGFVADLDFNSPWAIVSTGSAGNGVYARSSGTGDVLLGAGLLGSPHRYRIAWTATGFDFFVDGASTPGATLSFATSGPMRVGASDFFLNLPLAVDWVHVSPHPSSGTFSSRVFDAGATADWGTLSWIAQTPAVTSAGFEVRTGNTAVPDATWTAFTPITASGDPIDGISRYLQYRVVLSTADADRTPAIERVALTFAEFQNTPPTADATSVPTDEDTPVSVTLSGIDFDGDPLTFAVVDLPTNGTLGAISAPVCVGTTCTAEVTYTPAANFNGVDGFTYTVRDGFATSDPAVANLVVAAVNDAPSATGDAYEVGQPSTLSVGAPGVLANDSDVDDAVLTAVLDTGVAHGALTLNADGSFSYVPASGFVGTDSFTYVANDGAATSNPATVMIAVQPDTTAPAPPTGLNASPTSASIVLDWSDNTELDLAGYNVYRSSSPDGPFTLLNGLLLTVSGFTDTAAPAGQTSSYRVTAVDGVGNESDPTAISATRGVVAFRTASSAENRVASSLVIPRPQGLQLGDVMVAGISVRSAPGVTAPTGWSLLQNTITGTVLRQVTYFKVAGAGEPATYSWTFSSSQGAAGGIVAYTGVDPQSPVDASGGQATTSSTQITAPSITTTSQASLLVGLFGIASNPTIAPPAGMLEQIEVSMNSGRRKVALEISDEAIGGPSPTGARVAAASAAAGNVGQVVALRAAGGPPPVDEELPTIPQNVTATVVSALQVHVAWGPSSDNVAVDHYTVFREEVGAGTGPVGVGTSVGSSFTDRAVQPSTTYVYTVTATDAAGNTSGSSDPSPPVTTPDVANGGIQFVGASFTPNRRDASLVIGRPAGVQAGHLLVASIDVRGSPQVTPPGGWELLARDDLATTLTKVTYWRVASAAEPAAYAWAFSAPQGASGAILAYSGVDVQNPIDATAGQVNETSSTSITVASLTTTTANSMLVGFFGIATNASISPQGMTDRGEAILSSGSKKVSLGGADVLQAAAGAGGPFVATASRAGPNIGRIVALRPAGP